MLSEFQSKRPPSPSEFQDAAMVGYRYFQESPIALRDCKGMCRNVRRRTTKGAALGGKYLI